MSKPIRKTILITGASSGLGEGMARLFAAKGRNLALCARRLDRLEALKAELLQKHPGIRIELRALDVNQHDQVFAVFNDFKQTFGTIDRVIVNAGLGKGQPIGKGRFDANLQTAQPISRIKTFGEQHSTVSSVMGRAPGHQHCNVSFRR